MIGLGMQPFAGVAAGIAIRRDRHPLRLVHAVANEPGTRELEKVLGFREFLSRVEGDRLQRVVKTPEMFEKYLPFAMALGVEDNWAKAFDGIYAQSPSWYTGPGGVGSFRPSSFTHNLGAMSAAAATTMSSRAEKQRRLRLQWRVERRGIRRRWRRRILAPRPHQPRARHEVAAWPHRAPSPQPDLGRPVRLQQDALRVGEIDIKVVAADRKQFGLPVELPCERLDVVIEIAVAGRLFVEVRHTCLDPIRAVRQRSHPDHGNQCPRVDDCPTGQVLPHRAARRCPGWPLRAPGIRRTRTTAAL